MSSTKYSHMSNEEFIRFAYDMVGDDLYQEALARLEKCVDAESDVEALEREHESEMEALQCDHEVEVDRLQDTIDDLRYRLEEAA